MGKIKAILLFILITGALLAVRAQSPLTLRDFGNQACDSANADAGCGFRFSIITGPVFSNQQAKFDSIDLDGPDNIYGEKDVLQDGFYFNSGLNKEFNNGTSVFGSYSIVKLNKNKIARIGDTLTLDNQYPLIQHQFYASGEIPLGNGFFLCPALNYLNERYEKVMPGPGADSLGYIFPVESFRLNYFVGFLQLTREFHIFKPGIFAAISNFDDRTQVQAGIHFLVLPFGNLNLCLSSRLLDHRDDNVDYIIFEQSVGLRLSHSIRAEVAGTFGKMSNYHEDNAFVVYNLIDIMKFKGMAKIIICPGLHWMITGEYDFLMNEGEYITYHINDNQDIIPGTQMKDFLSQVFIIGVELNF
jgi:hypothetical protein